MLWALWITGFILILATIVFLINYFGVYRAAQKFIMTTHHNVVSLPWKTVQTLALIAPEKWNIDKHLLYHDWDDGDIRFSYPIYTSGDGYDCEEYHILLPYLDWAKCAHYVHQKKKKSTIKQKTDKMNSVMSKMIAELQRDIRNYQEDNDNAVKEELKEIWPL